MQAAVPAGCYDPSEAVNSYGRFTTAESSMPTPDWANTRGYRARLGGVTGNLVNFYNADDYALVGGTVNWELNQIACKPNVIKRTVFGAPSRWYAWYPPGFPDPALANRGWFCDADSVTERWVHDDHESMSFIARPRSMAVGRVRLRVVRSISASMSDGIRSTGSRKRSTTTAPSLTGRFRSLTRSTPNSTTS